MNVRSQCDEWDIGEDGCEKNEDFYCGLRISIESKGIDNWVKKVKKERRIEWLAPFAPCAGVWAATLVATDVQKHDRIYAG